MAHPWLVKLAGIAYASSLRSQSPGGKSGNTAVLRLDGMGDYILFRPVLPLLKARYKSLSYICSTTVASLASFLDGDLFAEIIPVDPVRLEHDPAYTKKIFKDLRSRHFSRCLHPTWSRTFMADVLATASGARLRVAWNGDLINQRRLFRYFTDPLYTDLLGSANPRSFEFERNKEFLSALGLGISHLSLARSIPSGEPSPFAKSVAYALGASVARKRMPLKKIIRIVKDLRNTSDSPVLLLGGKDVAELGLEISNSLEQHIALNLAGRTTLKEVTAIIAQASLVVSHDSFAAHLSAASGTPTVTLTNGSLYGRFFPYPETIAPKLTVLYPPDFPQLPHEHLCAHFCHESNLSVGDIPTEDIAAAARAALGCGKLGTALPRRWA